MNIREMRDVINVYKRAGEDIYENGFPVQGLVPVYENLRAKWKTTSTKEYIAADRSISEVTYKFVCYNRGFDAGDMFIAFKGKMYNVKNVSIFDTDRKFCELTATETSEFTIEDIISS